MGIVTHYPPGTFCWLDLGTTDLPAAKAFYSGLFDWEIVDLPTPDDSLYSMCRLDGSDVTAIHEHTSGEAAGWTTYIAVDDVDIAIERAAGLGARVEMPPRDNRRGARTSEITDPTGARVTLYQTYGHIGAALINESGAWTWTELVTPDLDRVCEFYGALFGWSAQTPTQGRISFHLADLLIAGAHLPNPGEHPDPRWEITFRVADVDITLRRATELGGSVVFGPLDIPVGRFGILADSSGVASTVASFDAVVGSVAPD